MRPMIARRPNRHIVGATNVGVFVLTVAVSAWAAHPPGDVPVRSLEPNSSEYRTAPWSAARVVAEVPEVVGSAVFEVVMDTIAPIGGPDIVRRDATEWHRAAGSPEHSQELPAWVSRELLPMLALLESRRWEGDNAERLKRMSDDAAKLEALEASVVVTESARRVAASALRLAIARQSGDPAVLATARADAAERLEAVLELPIGEQPTRQCPLRVRQAAELLLLREGALTGDKLGAARGRLHTADCFLPSKIAEGLAAYDRATTEDERRSSASAAGRGVMEGMTRADLIPEAEARATNVIFALNRLSDSIRANDRPLSVRAARYFLRRGPIAAGASSEQSGGADGVRWLQILHSPEFAELPSELRLEFATSATAVLQDEHRSSWESVPDATRQLLIERLAASMDGGSVGYTFMRYRPLEQLLDRELDRRSNIIDGPRAVLIGRVIDGLARRTPAVNARRLVLFRVRLELGSRDPALSAWSAALDRLAQPPAEWATGVDGRDPLITSLRLAIARVVEESEIEVPPPGLVERARLLVRTAQICAPSPPDLFVDARRALASAVMRSSRERAAWASEFDALIEASRMRAADTPWVEPADAEQFERARWATRLRQAGRGDDARSIAIEVTTALTVPGKSIVGRAAFWLAWAEVLESVAASGPSGEGEARVRLRALAAVDPTFGRIDDQERAKLPGSHPHRQPTTDEREAIESLSATADRLTKLSQRVEKAK
jgi:hypothetical protein